jgi:hypothetical protein
MRLRNLKRSGVVSRRRPGAVGGATLVSTGERATEACAEYGSNSVISACSCVRTVTKMPSANSCDYRYWETAT